MLPARPKPLVESSARSYRPLQGESTCPPLKTTPPKGTAPGRFFIYLREGLREGHASGSTKSIWSSPQHLKGLERHSEKPRAFKALEGQRRGIKKAG